MILPIGTDHHLLQVNLSMGALQGVLNLDILTGFGASLGGQMALRYQPTPSSFLRAGVIPRRS